MPQFFFTYNRSQWACRCDTLENDRACSRGGGERRWERRTFAFGARQQRVAEAAHRQAVGHQAAEHLGARPRGQTACRHLIDNLIATCTHINCDPIGPSITAPYRDRSSIVELPPPHALPTGQSGGRRCALGSPAPPLTRSAILCYCTPPINPSCHERLGHLQGQDHRHRPVSRPPLRVPTLGLPAREVWHPGGQWEAASVVLVAADPQRCPNHNFCTPAHPLTLVRPLPLPRRHGDPEQGEPVVPVLCRRRCTFLVPCCLDGMPIVCLLCAVQGA